MSETPAIPEGMELKQLALTSMARVAEYSYEMKCGCGCEFEVNVLDESNIEFINWVQTYVEKCPQCNSYNAEEFIKKQYIKENN